MAHRTRTPHRFIAALRHGWNSKPTAIVAIVVLAVAVIVVLLSTLLGIVAPVNTDQGLTSKATPNPIASPVAAAGRCDVATTGEATEDVPSDLGGHAGRGGISWPVSATVGPTTEIDGFPACFARTPTGAALAATTSYMGQYDSGHSVRDLLNFYIADGPGKSITVEGTAKGQTPPEQMRAQGLSVTGYSVEAFSQDRAIVDIVFTQPASSTGYFAIPLTMVWTGNDWKASVLDNGELFSGNPLTPSAHDFTTWEVSNG